jgi:site-specific DNA-adenine methylase
MSKPKFLKPFFSYFGGKWRAAPRYPEPKYPTIIEPFAGSAGYSLRYYDRDVVLYEKYAELVHLWKWLIEEATYESVMALPVIGEFSHLDELDVPYGARMLIGFNLNKAVTSPMKSPSKWSRDQDYGNDSGFWIKEKRQRVAEQIEHIKHWKIHYVQNLQQIPNNEATWFIDPPYQDAGRLYKHSSKNLDFGQLATWCLMREGQAIVCENDGADWFRFDHHFLHQSTTNIHRDTIYRYEVFAHLQDGRFV